jgi:hypothetical protein
MGDGVEAEQGLTLLVGEFVAGHGSGTEAVPGMPLPPSPGGGDLQAIGG